MNIYISVFTFCLFDVKFFDFHLHISRIETRQGNVNNIERIEVKNEDENNNDARKKKKEKRTCDSIGISEFVEFQGNQMQAKKNERNDRHKTKTRQTNARFLTTEKNDSSEMYVYLCCIWDMYK